ncbi:MAG: hypothetical protein A2Y14_04285 [Verrucomicrobia bacterium GWF2_51_19]|nr:MAG: hypothetical protein A2Y14_04285 [Verrucomicrobia bacterium GWF2_51_19]HCJ12229.1 hypothetical protein [Opitutae bacterium]
MAELHADKNEVTLSRLILILGLIPLTWILMDGLGYLHFADNWVMNLHFWIAPKKASPLKIMYVDIDKEAIELMGEEPVPLMFYAQAVDALFRYSTVKVVGTDMIFAETAYSKLVDSEKLKKDHDVFKYVIAHSPYFVLGATYDGLLHESISGKVNGNPFPYLYNGHEDLSKNRPPTIARKSLSDGVNANYGLTDVDEHMSAGAIPRWVPLFSQTQNGLFLNMALEMSRLYYQLPKEAVKLYPERVILLGVNGTILMEIPLTREQLVEIHWSRKWNDAALSHISLANVIKARHWMANGTIEQQSRAKDFFGQFNGGIVFLINEKAEGNILIHTPIDFKEVPASVVQTNLLEMFFTKNFIQRLPPWGNLLILVILNSLAALSILYNERSPISTRVFMLILLTYVGLNLYAFYNFTVVLPLIAPLGSVLTTLGWGVSFQLIEERKQKRRIRGFFSTYISPELVNSMIEAGEEPQLGGVEKNITAFFSDIQSFSSFSEVMSPNQLVELMNEYLTAMTQILKEQGGTLDKFIGDAIVAMFGAPLALENHALKACVAACRMQQIQDKLREKWRVEGDKWPKQVSRMRTRIGVNTGVGIVGNMGSEVRFNYTMMGDNVNLAARCESGAKAYGVYSMCTEDTQSVATQQGNDVVFRELDRIVVKGRTKAVTVYEIMGLRNQLEDSVFECIDVFEKGLKKYFLQEWDEAISYFERSAGLEPLRPGRDAGVSLNPTMLFLQRCKQMKSEPPEPGWDGVFVMHTK